MGESGANQATAQSGWIGKLLTFRGRIGRKEFVLGLAAEIGALLAGMYALAALNNPTGSGGGAIVIAIIFPLTAIYFHLCLAVARLRDAGAAKPVPLGIIVAVLPFLWAALTFELIEYLWPLIFAVFLLLYFGPAISKTQAVEAPQS